MWVAKFGCMGREKQELFSVTRNTDSKKQVLSCGWVDPGLALCSPWSLDQGSHGHGGRTSHKSSREHMRELQAGQ